MRRGTLITIVVLLLALAGAAAFQIYAATQDRAPYPGPLSPGAAP